MSLTRFAIRLALSPDKQHRWRQVSVVACTAIATVIGILFLAVCQMSLHAVDVSWNRSYIDTDNASQAVGVMVATSTEIDGRQVELEWIEPLPGHEDDPSAVPIGLNRMPAPGEAVLSPGIMDAGYTAEDLGWVTSDAGSGEDGAIGPDGVITQSEPLAYIRPATGRSLAAHQETTHYAGFRGRTSEKANIFTVLETDMYSYETDNVVPLIRQSLGGGFVLFLLPALLLIFSGSRALSPVRDERMRFFVLLGVPTRKARRILAVESATLALLGAVVGIVAYTALISWQTSLPFAGLALYQGAFHINPLLGLLVVLATIAVAAFCGSRGRIAGNTRATHTHRAHWWMAVPLALGLLCLFSVPSPAGLVQGLLKDSSGGITTLYAGIILLAVGVPLAVPVLTAWTGRLISRSHTPVRFLAGRSMKYQAVHLARPAALLALVVFLTGTSLAIYAGATSNPTEPDSPGSSRVLDVSWTDPQPGDVEDATERLSRAGIDAVVLPVGSASEFDTVVQVDDCAKTVALLDGDSAACSDPRTLDSLLQARLGARAVDDVSAVDIDPSSRYWQNVEIIASAPFSLPTVQKALGSMPALNPSVRSGDVTAPFFQADWLLAGTIFTLFVLGVAVVRELGDRALEGVGRDNLLARAGLDEHEIDRVGTATLAVPTLAALPMGFVCAVLAAYSGQVPQQTDFDPTKLFVVFLVTFLASAVTLAGAYALRRTWRSHR